jgi:PAS domain S-box-containing protein
LESNLDRDLAEAPLGDHICLIYESRAEQMQALVPYVRGGLARGECCIYLSSDGSADVLRDALQSAGVDVAAAQGSGLLRLVDGPDPLGTGTPGHEAVVGAVRSLINRARSNGCPGVRLAMEMGWVLAMDPTAAEIVEAETRYISFLAEMKAVSLCLYSRETFPPSVLIGLVRCHARLIVGGRVRRNIYSDPPAGPSGRPLESTMLEWMLTRLRVVDAMEQGLHGQMATMVAELETRQRTEDALRESEARFRMLFENMSGAVEVYSAVDDGRDFLLVDFNRAAESMSGISRGEAIGKRWLELFPSARECGMWDVAQSVYRNGSPERQSYHYLDGRIDGWRDASVFKLPSGEIVVVIDDITRQKLAEQRREEYLSTLSFLSSTATQFVELGPEEDIYRFIGESLRELVGDGYIIVNSYDPSTRGLMVKTILGLGDRLKGVLETLGRSPVGMSFGFTEEAMQCLTNGHMVLLEGGLHTLTFGQLPQAACLALERLGGLGKIYTMGFAKQGELLGNAVVLLRRGVELRNEEAVHAFIKQASVALQRRRAEEALRESEQQLMRAQRLETAGRIAGQVAHDFNNLLGPLTAYPELIKMQLPDGHPSLAYCDAMLESADRMAEINEDMMALGRRGHFDQQPVEMNRVVQQAVAQLGRASKGLTVRLQLYPALLPLSGSPAQLLRVMANLISNAREAMHDGGTLTVKTENTYLDGPLGRYNRVEQGPYVRVGISDTGSGIAPDVQDRIFDAFFTTKSSAGRRGCGLGLSVVLAIVEDHHGYVDLDTEVGRGTTFSVYLPASQTTTRDESVGGIRSGSESILVVDDDPLQRQVVMELLQTLGYRVFAVSSGESALEYMRDQEAALVILDMIMPGGMDGAETFRRLLEIRPHQRALVVSGFAESDRAREAQNLGAGVYLRKPVTLEKLSSAVRVELDRP